MDVDICIPTMRVWDEIQSQIKEIERTVGVPHKLIASCHPLSAACNRNICLDQATSPIIITVDDDVTGFFPGWDELLIAPLLADLDVCMVAARLLDQDGSIQETCLETKRLKPDWLPITPRGNAVMPSAAIAFRNLGLRYDEHYIGSGWEDTDFCHQYLQLPNGPSKFVCVNTCKLVHLHEQKMQGGRFWEVNSKYFSKKWGVRV